MTSRIGAHIRTNVIGYIALFLVLTGGTAYALDGSNTVFSDDIADGEVKSADVQNLGVANADLAANSVGSGKIANGGVATADIANNAVTTDKVADGTLTGQDVSNDSLSAADLGPNSVGALEIGSDQVTPAHLNLVDSLAGDARTCDDAVGGSATNCGNNFSLGSRGIAVFFSCDEAAPGAVAARIRVREPNDANFWAVDSHAPNGAQDQTGLGSADSKTLAQTGPTTNSHFQGGDYAVFASSADASSRSVITGEAATGTHVFGHDCAFAFSAIG